MPITLKISLVTFVLLFSVAPSAKKHQPNAAIIKFVDSERFQNRIKNSPYINQQGYDQTQITIEHLEIPRSHPNFWTYDFHRDWFENPNGMSPFGLMIHFSDYLPKHLKSAFTFDRDGQEWIRFPLSPDDQVYGQKIRQYFESLSVPITTSQDYFKGYRTSSRSIIVVTPEGHSVSVKPSTSATSQGNGPEQDRPYPARWASLAVQLSEYIYSLRGHLKYLGVAWEAGAVAIPPLFDQDPKFGGGDLAFSIRLMEGPSRGDEIHYSGFVLSDQEFSKNLAAEAGMSYQDFWKEAYTIKGRAMAELAAIVGFQFTSAHEQNFRWVLDAKSKRIIRVEILDLTDGHPNADIWELNGQQQLLKDWQRFGLEVEENTPVRNAIQVSYLSDSVKLPKYLEEAFERGVYSRMSDLTQFNKSEFFWNSVEYIDGQMWWLEVPYQTDQLAKKLTWQSASYCNELKSVVKPASNR